jgi:hypothetical protein
LEPSPDSPEKSFKPSPVVIEPSLSKAAEGVTKLFPAGPVFPDLAQDSKSNDSEKHDTTTKKQ